MIWLKQILSSLQPAYQVTKKVFATEIFGVAKSIAENSDSLYHGTKSNLLQCFTFDKKELDIDKGNSAIINDLQYLY